MVKKVKTAIKKAQFTKIKKATTIQDNTKKILTKKGEKVINKKKELNKIPNISTATQGDESHIIT